MSKALTTLGEMKPGDYGTLPDGTRIMVTGQTDCATLWRYAIGDHVDVKRGPMSNSKDTRVNNVVTRAAAVEGKLGDSDPLRGVAR